MSISSATDETAASPAISSLMTFLFAATCGLVAANLYYGQPLAGPISADLGWQEGTTGAVRAQGRRRK